MLGLLPKQGMGRLTKRLQVHVTVISKSWNLVTSWLLTQVKHLKELSRVVPSPKIGGLHEILWLSEAWNIALLKHREISRDGWCPIVESLKHLFQEGHNGW